MAGATPRTSVDSYWKNGTIPWMASGEIHKKRVYEVDKFITQEGYDNSSTKLVPKNSVLIALAGQGKTRGTVAINKIELCTNQSIATMIPNINKLDYNYLYYYLESKYDKLRLLSSSDGGRGGLNLKILKNLKIKNIPLETQQYISNFLLILDKKIELLEKTLVLYQKLEEKIRRDIFNFKENCIDFERYTLEDIAHIKKGFTPSTQNEKYWRMVNING